MESLNAIGRRKRSVARVFLSQGNGEITVNGKKLDEYFPMKHIRSKITEPFDVANVENTYNIKVNVNGGGFKGQAEAIRLGISRLLVQIDEELKQALKSKKLLTRDSRVVERKKFGKPKARKSFQFSKR